MKVSRAVALLPLGYQMGDSGIAKGIVYLLIATVLGIIVLLIRSKPRQKKPRVFLAGAVEENRGERKAVKT
ncbi:MAG: hypothetical protein QMC89_05235 [Candidatus Hodarchaeaceae archaeon]|nr:hypothetical protein [Candidatus Hodarchaeaceae archaeon]